MYFPEDLRLLQSRDCKMSEIFEDMAPCRKGYHRMAALVGTNPDLAIFRRFSILNTKNLMYMQGELIELGVELDLLASQDRDSQDLDMTQFEFSVERLMAAHASDSGSKQWDKILEVRQKLEAYSSSFAPCLRYITLTMLLWGNLDKALHRFHKLFTLENVNTSDLQHLRQWIKQRNGGNKFLQGFERDTWDGTHDNDLVSLTARDTDQDVLSKWIDHYAVPLYHRVLGHRYRVRYGLS